MTWCRPALVGVCFNRSSEGATQSVRLLITTMYLMTHASTIAGVQLHLRQTCLARWHRLCIREHRGNWLHNLLYVTVSCAGVKSCLVKVRGSLILVISTVRRNRKGTIEGQHVRFSCHRRNGRRALLSPAKHLPCPRRPQRCVNTLTARAAAARPCGEAPVRRYCLCQLRLGLRCSARPVVFGLRTHSWNTPRRSRPPDPHRHHPHYPPYLSGRSPYSPRPTSPCPPPPAHPHWH
jgi:hypothetical protein